MTAWGELDAPPYAEWHDSMMDDMEGRHLIVSLSHNEEERVEELCELAEVVPPTTFSHLMKKVVN